MMKRFLALALVLALACATAVTGFAADEEEKPTTVEYTGSALNYVDGKVTMDMSQVLPGVPSEGKIVMTNKSGALANFYVDTTVVRTLEGTKTSGYTVKLWVETKDGTTVLFGGDLDENNGGQVGGNDNGSSGNQELMELNDMLAANADGISTQADGENYLLAATLANEESATLKLSITPDGTATTKNYSGKENDDKTRGNTGLIQFKFMAEQIDIQTRTETRTVKGETTVVTQTRYWLNGVQTGDPVAIVPLAIVLVLAVLVFIVAAKKKSKKEE